MSENERLGVHDGSGEAGSWGSSNGVGSGAGYGEGTGNSIGVGCGYGRCTGVGTEYSQHTNDGGGCTVLEGLS